MKIHVMPECNPMTLFNNPKLRGASNYPSDGFLSTSTVLITHNTTPHYPVDEYDGQLDVSWMSAGC